MTKTATKRRLPITRVLEFFRSGNPDEIRAVQLILASEGLLSVPPTVRRGRPVGAKSRRRLNGTDASEGEIDADVFTESNTREATA